MKKSNNSQEMSKSQPLAQGAACLSSMGIENESLPPHQQAVIHILLLLLDGLSRNVMSADVWALVYHSARAKACEAGIEEKIVDEALDRIAQSQRALRDTNPMRDMF